MGSWRWSLAARPSHSGLCVLSQGGLLDTEVAGWRDRQATASHTGSGMRKGRPCCTQMPHVEKEVPAPEVPEPLGCVPMDSPSPPRLQARALGRPPETP